MLNLLLREANPKQVKKWNNWAGINTAGQGTISIGVLVTRFTQILPQERILEAFTYMALAIALITAFPLRAFPKVISLSLAQLGIATSLIYLGCSFMGFFQPPYNFVIIVILIIITLVFLMLFSSGLGFLWSESKPEFFLGVLILVMFLAIWLYPIWVTWR